MKIINCGIVTYVITEHHIATICYNYNNGQPAATIYYDGRRVEVVESEDGQTMRLAVRLATWTVKNYEYCEGL